MSTKAPVLAFDAAAARGLATGAAGAVAVDLDALLEFALFVYGVTRSGKTNFNRWVLEQTYGQVQQLVVDPDGEYATLRTSDRPYLIVGAGRDVALPTERGAVMTLVDGILANDVSTIFDVHDLDDHEQQLVVAALCDALVRLPERSTKNIVLVLEELQEWAPQNGGSLALAPVRRLAKRGLKRGVTILGSTQRVSDVSKGVTTQLKNKVIGGADADDAPRALKELGLPASERAAVMELHQGHFQVKGPAFSRHAVHVRVPLAETSPPKRRRGDPPAPAAEAPAAIAKLARELAKAVSAPDPASAKGERRFDHDALHAIGQATQRAITRHAKPSAIEDVDVKESEARALRAENEQLRSRLEALESDQPKRLDAGDDAPKRLGDAHVTDREVPIGMLSERSTEDLYQAIKQRLVKEAPGILRVLTVKPELEVLVERQVISAKGDTLRGRLARLLAAGYFDNGATGVGAQKELARRGNDPGPANAYAELDKLAEMGFLTIEQSKDERGRPRKLFKAVPDMKVNVVER